MRNKTSDIIGLIWLISDVLWLNESKLAIIFSIIAFIMLTYYTLINVKVINFIILSWFCFNFLWMFSDLYNIKIDKYSFNIYGVINVLSYIIYILFTKRKEEKTED